MNETQRRVEFTLAEMDNTSEIYGSSKEVAQALKDLAGKDIIIPGVVFRGPEGVATIFTTEPQQAMMLIIGSWLDQGLQKEFMKASVLALKAMEIIKAKESPIYKPFDA